MIAAPINDQTCLAQITDVVRDLVQRQDPAFVELAETYGTTEGVIDHLRSLPQRDDTGDPTDGPRAKACRPSQRIRLSPLPEDPNCVERAAIYMGVAELLDPEPVRQLKTKMTKWGLHTFPVENCWAVVLDPRMSRNALNADIFQTLPLAHPMRPHDAVDWLVSIAEEPAARVVGGLERVRDAHDAMHALLDGHVLDEGAVDDVAYTCALAVQEALHFGAAGRVLIRETIRALGMRMPRFAEPVIGPAVPVSPEAELRNALSLKIGKYKISPNWNVLGALGRVGLKLGTDVGMAALGAKLGAVGLTPLAMSALEHEFNREGLSLGALAPRTPSLAALALLPSLESIGRTKTPATAKAAAAATSAKTADAAIGSLAAPATTAALRNAWIATPGLIKAEMQMTEADIRALGNDINAAFRAPYEQEFAKAEARFEKEMGRIPGVGKPGERPGDPGVGFSSKKICDAPLNDKEAPICKWTPVKLTPGVNDFIDSKLDWERVYSYMNPRPTPIDIKWKSYQGEFAKNWGDFAREWDDWYFNHSGFASRTWGATRDVALEFRKRAKTWREQFVKLGGVPHSPSPEMPTYTNYTGPRLPSLDGLGSGLKTAAIVAGVGVATLATVAILRR